MVGQAILEITANSNSVQISNFGKNSFQITNIGTKTIAQIDIDVTDALYSDSVFDPFGQAGDTSSKPLTIDNNGDTGIVAPSDASYIGVGEKSGYKGLQLKFSESVNGGFESGETIGFSVDMDPNSVAGTEKAPLDSGSTPNWDVGGVSGAELIGSTFTVTFTDGTTATGQLQGTNNQSGSQGLADQASPNLEVDLMVNGIEEGGIGTYNANQLRVIVNGPIGQTVRVILTKGFIQPVTSYAAFLQTQLNELAEADFPANNAVEFQTVDVLLSEANQDISENFDFSGVDSYDFAGEDQLPLGFVASVIDVDNNDFPLGKVTDPIYLKFSEAEVPVVVESQTPTDIEPEVPVVVESETPTDIEPEVPVAVESETPTDVAPEVPVVAESKTPTDVEPEVPVVVESKTPVDVEPEVPVAVESKTPVDKVVDVRGTETEKTEEPITAINTDTDKVTVPDNDVVYRFFNPQAGVHLYTNDENEKEVVENSDHYSFEGAAFRTVDPLSGNAEDVYRFFNSRTGVHLYTTDEKERDFINENLEDFSFEGTVFSAYETQVKGSIPIYRFFESTIGVHFYTPHEAEKDFVEANLSNYRIEGIAYYALPLETADV